MTALVPLLLGLAFQTRKMPEPVFPPLPPYDSAWTREAWTADEAPYLTVRREVEAYTLGRRVSKTKTDLVDQTSRMVTSWRANPKNPVILYRAAYYEWMLDGLDFSDDARKLLRANWIDMGSIPSPHSREYDRLRMLREGFLNEVFLDLGERLYKLDPNDRDLALKLEWIHAIYGPGNPKRAIEIATRLLKTGDPKAYPTIYYAYALAHGRSYLTDITAAQKHHAEQAFWGYRQYLAAGSAWRPKAIEAKRYLDGFEKYLKDHGQPVPSG